jgi:sugar lactone lactonase YvrE
MARWRWWALAVGLTLAGFPTVASAPRSGVRGLAPVDVIERGFDAPAGLAVGEPGLVYVADRQDGTVTRLTADGRRRVVLHRLDEPVGLALGPEGDLLVAEADAGRVLRWDPAGTVAVLAWRLGRPRWLARDPGGILFVATGGRRDRHHHQDDDGDHGRRDDRILARHPGGTITVWADGLAPVRGLALHDGALHALVRGRGPSARLVAWPIGAGGLPGAPVVRELPGLRRPGGLAFDRLGAVFVTGRDAGSRRHHDRDDGVVLKGLPDGRWVVFASSLGRPGALALDGAGHLYVTDAEDRGWLLRFRAPAAPAVIGPAGATVSPVTLTGQAEPGSRVSVAPAADPAGVLAWAAADRASGVFTVAVPLQANAANDLVVLATGAAGLGLTGPPAALSVLHDDQPPAVAIVAPPGGGVVRRTVGVEAAATDSGSGIASLVVSLGGQALATVANPDPARPLVAAVSLDTTRLADGVHTVSAVAADVAGNVTTTSQSFTVDNAPPETTVGGGPGGGSAATFSFTGSDGLTPPGAVEFSWRLDDGPWSPFGAEATVTLTVLAAGPHVFSVRARDRAGNEDPTPAEIAFTVQALRVTIEEPAAGAFLIGGAVLVRGTVEGALPGQEVVVRVNGLVAAVSGTRWAVEIGLDAGPHVVSASASGPGGAAAVSEVPVTIVEGSVYGAVLRALPGSGVAPREVRWEVANQVELQFVGFELDAMGTGAFGPFVTSVAELTTTYTTPGLWFPVVRAWDIDGVPYLATTVVHVESAEAVTERVQRVWTGFTGRLQTGDIEGALTYLAPVIHERFRRVFEALGPSLPAVAAGFGQLEVLEQVGDIAEAAIVQMENGVPMLYFVYLHRDGLGRWLIEEM